MQTPSRPPSSRRPLSRRTLVLLAAVTAMPFVAASGLYLSGWRPTDTINSGTLILPPAPLADATEWRGRWSLLFIHDGPCGADCMARLDELQRLRVSLGQEMNRTRIVWQGAAPAAEAAALKARMPELGALERRPAGLEALPPGSVVLVDPGGLAMMRYRPGADTKGMRTDLQRLLKYARTA